MTLKTEIVTVATDSGVLHGSLLSSTEKMTGIVALIIAGSGPTDRDGNNPAMENNSLKMLAEGLAETGIASLRYDKRGIGKSAVPGLTNSDLRIETYINDALLWLDYLHDLNTFKTIVVIGHSEGSLIGMIASAHQAVSKFVSIAGPGRRIDQLMREQLGAQSASLLKQAEPVFDKLVQGRLVADIPDSLSVLAGPAIQPYLISQFKFDPVIEITKLDKPVLVVQGDADIQVTVGDAERLAESNANAKLVVIENMNHVLKYSGAGRQKNIATYSQPDLPVNTELLRVIKVFLTR